MNTEEYKKELRGLNKRVREDSKVIQLLVTKVSVLSEENESLTSQLSHATSLYYGALGNRTFLSRTFRRILSGCIKRKQGQ